MLGVRPCGSEMPEGQSVCIGPSRLLPGSATEVEYMLKRGRAVPLQEAVVQDNQCVIPAVPDRR